MRRSELLLWADRYKTDRGNRYKAELGKRDKIHGQGFVTKSDLIWLTRWKFDGYGLVLGRRLAEAKSNPARRVEEVSKLVLGHLKALNPWTVVEALGLLNGVGPAMASVILTFYAPRTFGVYDQHMWNTLRAENKVSGDIEGSTEQYIDALEVLRRIAAQYSLSVREVEIAYFSKDYYSDEE